MPSSPRSVATRVTDNQTIDSLLSVTSISVAFTPNPGPLDYRVTIENLSKRYSVKSVISDKTNLVLDVLKLPAPLTSHSRHDSGWAGHHNNSVFGILWYHSQFSRVAVAAGSNDRDYLDRNRGPTADRRNTIG